MKQARARSAALRALTDRSLGAERAGADAAAERSATTAQRVLDDLIERDRLVADGELLLFRERADAHLARKRGSAAGVASERRAADDGKQLERDAMDAVVELERQRADRVVETERHDQVLERARAEVRRHDTDDQLSTERGGDDVRMTALDDSKAALAVARAEQSLRDDVLGMVAHDLRGPLSILAMNAECILADTEEPATRQAAREMTLSAARMNRLLKDLLDVVRIEHGALEVVKREHDVGTLLGEVLRSYRPLFAERGLTFSVELPAEPVLAQFDHDRVVQVLSNLLGNALKFTPKGGAVELRVEPGARPIEILVRDSGRGIRPDMLPHVFERFWQVESAERRGLGLGLYICKKIVEAHGGRIWAESDFGRGTTIRFTLPDRASSVPRAATSPVGSPSIA